MKIIRDGIEIELTERELREAYNEQDLAYYAMDLVEHASLWGQELSTEEALMMAESARDNVNDNDGYFEHYWESIGQTLNENGIYDAVDDEVDQEDLELLSMHTEEDA